MSKVKTHKGTAKRLRVTKTGKIMHRASGQDHFNARDTGNDTKNKRRDVGMHKTHDKLKTLIPYK